MYSVFEKKTNGGMRPVNKYDNLMHEDVNGNLFFMQATAFVMSETKTSSTRSDQFVLDLQQYIREYDASVGQISRIVLGQDESPTKQTTGERKKSRTSDDSSLSSPEKTTNTQFVTKTLNEVETGWVKKLDKATFTGPYVYAKARYLPSYTNLSAGFAPIRFVVKLMCIGICARAGGCRNSPKCLGYPPGHDVSFGLINLVQFFITLSKIF